MKLRGLFLGFGVAGVATFAWPMFVACSSDNGPNAADTDAAAPVCDGNLDAFRFASGGDGSSDPFGAKAAGQARAGALEGSGADPARSMVDMIASLRAFESGQKAIQAIDDVLGKAANAVGTLS